MCSHYGLKGTSKPTHYHVIVDDAGLQPDEIQRFTFDLCHMCAASTEHGRSPAPPHASHLPTSRGLTLTLTLALTLTLTLTLTLPWL